MEGLYHMLENLRRTGEELPDVPTKMKGGAQIETSGIGTKTGEIIVMTPTDRDFIVLTYMGKLWGVINSQLVKGKPWIELGIKTFVDGELRIAYEGCVPRSGLGSVSGIRVDGFNGTIRLEICDGE